MLEVESERVLEVTREWNSLRVDVMMVMHYRTKARNQKYKIMQSRGKNEKEAVDSSLHEPALQILTRLDIPALLHLEGILFMIILCVFVLVIYGFILCMKF